MTLEFDRIADKKRVDFILGAIRNAVPAGGEILDIGCGNGIITRAIGASGYSITGIDVSEKTIAIAAAQNYLPNVRFRVVSASALSADPSKYDAIICSEVLEHLRDPGTVLAAAYRLLKEQGVLIVTVPNGSGPRELLVTRPVQRLQTGNGPVWKLVKRIKSLMGYTGATVQSDADDLSHIWFFTRKDLLRLAASANFAVKEVRASNFIEQVFPFSILARRSRRLQQIDCNLADRLPISFTSGFMSVWTKL